MGAPKDPVVIYLGEEQPLPDVADAPPVTEKADPPDGAAMQRAARLANRRPSGLARWFWGLSAALTLAVISVTTWDFVISLGARSATLGWAVILLVAALLAVLTVLAVREVATFGRLSRIDSLRRDVNTVRATSDLCQARALVNRMFRLYDGRKETRWGRSRLIESLDDILDAALLMDVLENELLGPLDQLAGNEVEAAARQVAIVTALVPMALADVAAVLVANLRMIRRVAEIYGGRSGFLGSWRLTRAVLAHLVATGSVSVGEDMLKPVLGGSILSKLSRRFGEGLVNGALTARVGVAAMEICRPMPFYALRRPSVPGMVKNALTGLIAGRES